MASLGLQALRSALAGKYDDTATLSSPTNAVAFAGWRQGFVSNITNPKVLVFYLAVLPQFLPKGTAPGWLLLFAWSHALLSLLYLSAVTTALLRVRRLISRRSVRRAMDSATGVVLLGFSAKLATEHI